MSLHIQFDRKLKLFKFDELFFKTIISKCNGNINVATQNF